MLYLIAQTRWLYYLTGTASDFKMRGPEFDPRQRFGYWSYIFRLISKLNKLKLNWVKGTLNWLLAVQFSLHCRSIYFQIWTKLKCIANFMYCANDELNLRPIISANNFEIGIYQQHAYEICTIAKNVQEESWIVQVFHHCTDTNTDILPI